MNVTIGKTPLSVKILLVILLGIFVWSAIIAIEQTRLKYWPMSSAKIVKYDTGIVDSTGLQSWYANPRIRFMYEVDGDNFESETLNPSPLNYQSLRQLKSDTHGFHEGSVIKCWYNPNNPNVAYVINRGVTVDIWIIVVATGSLTLNAARVFISRQYSLGKYAG